ncbi:unnamed protein product [Peniophora sp. CBMAI 1063]|nr:unnamed protein product [Peniophora sp. CBMAI 1063]
MLCLQISSCRFEGLLLSSRRSILIVYTAIPELLKTKGQVIITTSQAAHLRCPAIADYSKSKHTLNRFVEILALGRLQNSHSTLSTRA